MAKLFPSAEYSSILLPQIQFSMQSNRIWKMILIRSCKGLKPIFRDETTTIQFAGICDWPRLTGLVADAGKLRRLSCSQDDFIYFLPVAATALRAAFQVYLSKLWVVDVTKEVRYDLLIYCLLSDISLYFLLVAATSLRAGFQVYLS